MLQRGDFSSRSKTDGVNPPQEVRGHTGMDVHSLGQNLEVHAPVDQHPLQFADFVDRDLVHEIRTGNSCGAIGSVTHGGVLRLAKVVENGQAQQAGCRGQSELGLQLRFLQTQHGFREIGVLDLSQSFRQGQLQIFQAGLL